MLKIFQSLNIENFKNAILNIFRRMPLSAIISLLAFVLLVVLIRAENLSKILENNLQKALVTLILSFFFSVAIYLFCESRQIANAKKWIYQIATLVFTLLFYYFFEENLFSSMQAETVVYVALTTLGILAFLFVSSDIRKYLVRVLSQENFYVTTYNLVLKSIMSIIVGVVSMILGAIALSAVFALFDIKNIEEGNWYGYWISFSVVLFAPMYFLANLPKVLDEKQAEISEVAANKFFSFLINYVGLPAIFIYFLILYAYTVKVLLNFSKWPQGEVTWLVILFSFFGYLIYFASYAFANNFKPAKIFRTILPIAVLLQTPMLFYAIGLRINQYDLTINRYLVLVFGLWLLGLSLYHIISKKKDLSVFFSSLLVVVILMSFGPWSVYLVPEWRQAARLEAKLKQANILQADKTIVPLKKIKDISAELSGEIYGGIEYLCNYHGCDTLNPIFAKEIIEIKKNDKIEWEKNQKIQIADAKRYNPSDVEWIKKMEEAKYPEAYNYTIIQKLAELLKVERFDTSLNTSVEPEYLRFSNENQYNLGDALEISGYDYYVQLSSVFNDMNAKTGLPLTTSGGKSSSTYSVILDVDSKELKLYLGKDVLEKFNIENSILKPILANEKNYIEPGQYDTMTRALLSNQNMTFILTGLKFNLKVVLGTISIKNPKWTPNQTVETDKEGRVIPTEIYGKGEVGGYVLLKKK